MCPNRKPQAILRTRVFVADISAWFNSESEIVLGFHLYRYPLDCVTSPRSAESTAVVHPACWGEGKCLPGHHEIRFTPNAARTRGLHRAVVHDRKDHFLEPLRCCLTPTGTKRRDPHPGGPSTVDKLRLCRHLFGTSAGICDREPSIGFGRPRAIGCCLARHEEEQAVVPKQRRAETER